MAAWNLTTLADEAGVIKLHMLYHQYCTNIGLILILRTMFMAAPCDKVTVRVHVDHLMNVELLTLRPTQPTWLRVCL